MSYFKKAAVNASLIKNVLKSPMYAWHNYHNPFKANDAMNFGSLVHAMVLGVGMDEFVKSPKFDRRTTQGKSDYNEFVFYNEGKTLIDETEWLKAMECASSVMSTPHAKDLIDLSEKEKWIDFELDGYTCKSKIDGYGEGFVYDLKTTSDIYSFDKVIKEYHYHTQLAFYGHAIGRPLDLDYFIIAISTKEPYECAVFNINSMIPEGNENIRKAIGYADQIVKGESFRNGTGVITL